MRRRISNTFLAFQATRSGLTLGDGVTFFGRPIVTRAEGGRIEVGNRVVLCSDSRRTSLGVSRPVILRASDASAEIVIGDDSGLSGTTIVSMRSVRIGRRCLIGADVLITDTDFHPVDLGAMDVSSRRYAPPPQPSSHDVVVIEDDVFIGARTVVLKGTHIGRGSVVGAGSVVVGEIPPGVIAAGAPARIIRNIPA